MPPQAPSRDAGALRRSEAAAPGCFTFSRWPAGHTLCFMGLSGYREIKLYSLHYRRKELTARGTLFAIECAPAPLPPPSGSGAGEGVALPQSHRRVLFRRLPLSTQKWSRRLPPSTWFSRSKDGVHYGHLNSKGRGAELSARNGAEPRSPY